MKKVSICLLSIDRYWLTKYTLGKILNNSGVEEIELLVLDNGSTDTRTIEYISSIADVHIQEPKNIGVSAGFNKLLRKATGDYICLIDNDILLNDNWLSNMIYWHSKFTHSGIVAIHCVLDKGDFVDGVYQRRDNSVYSTRLFHKTFLDKVGGFNESIGMYGGEDSELCFRAHMAKLKNFYVPNDSSIHLGIDYGTDSKYREFKDLALKKSVQNAKESIDKIRVSGNYKIIL